MMQLYNDATSPFGRKILVAAAERSIALDEVIVDCFSPGPLDDVNPLRQIPALVTDDGEALFDSDVILAWLDGMHDGPALIPEDARWPVLTRVALGNGLIEAVLYRVMELKRAEGEQSPAFIAKMEGRVARALSRLEASARALSADTLRADDITIACALEYADFRYPEDWRGNCPALAHWLEAVSARPSMTVSVPTRSVAPA
jgi:glutathione S-transferase